MQSDHRQPSNTQPPNMSKGVWFIVWIVILLLFVKFFEGQLGNRDKIVQQNKGPGEVVLKRSRNGHYFANGFINQSPVTFLLDTGATSVAIPKKSCRQTRPTTWLSTLRQHRKRPVRCLSNQAKQFIVWQYLLIRCRCEHSRRL